jgi:hypothetical protein
MPIQDLQVNYQPQLIKKRILKRKSDPQFLIQNLSPALLSNRTQIISKCAGILPRVASGGISF